MTNLLASSFSTEDRGSMFLTTKVRRNEHGYENCKKALLDSVTTPKPEYWDLVLLHDPLSGPEARHEAYRALGEYVAAYSRDLTVYPSLTMHFLWWRTLS
jgi:diketogulonate reductase-like aldo/keto reductase